NLVRLQVATESFQTARAKFAAVGATDLGRNAKCPPVRARPVKRRRRRNQNGLDQTVVSESKQKLARCVAGAEHAHDVDLAEGKFLREPISKLLRQVGHFVER